MEVQKAACFLPAFIWKPTKPRVLDEAFLHAHASLYLLILRPYLQCLVECVDNQSIVWRVDRSNASTLLPLYPCSTIVLYMEGVEAMWRWREHLFILCSKLYRRFVENGGEKWSIGSRSTQFSFLPALALFPFTSVQSPSRFMHCTRRESEPRTWDFNHGGDTIEVPQHWKSNSATGWHKRSSLLSEQSLCLDQVLGSVDSDVLIHGEGCLYGITCFKPT